MFSLINSMVKSTSISQNHVAFHQKIRLKSKYNGFKITAAAKVEKTTAKSVSAIWVRVDDKDGNSLYFDNMTDRPIISKNWSTFEIIGPIPQNSKYLYFGGLCMHSGKFYFSDFKAFIIDYNEKTFYKKIKNPSLKKISNQINLKGWHIGVRSNSFTVESFLFTSTVDDKKNCLLIHGDDSHDTLNDKFTIANQTIASILLTLKNLDNRMIKSLNQLTIQELDYVPFERASSIGELIMHIISIEKYYQIQTFEKRELNSKEINRLGCSIKLEEENNYKNKPSIFYLEKYLKTREETVKYLMTKDEDWLTIQNKNHDACKNNLYHWLHVVEHQSYHQGQISLILKHYHQNF